MTLLLLWQGTLNIKAEMPSSGAAKKGRVTYTAWFTNKVTRIRQSGETKEESAIHQCG